MQRPPEQLPRLDPRIRVRDLKIESAYTDISTAPLLPSAISHSIVCEDVTFNFYKDYKHKLGILGSGAFGEVRLAQNAATGEWVAIKRLERKPSPDSDADVTVLGPNTLDESINREVDLLEEMKKHTKISSLIVGPFIRELRSLNTQIKFLRGKLPRSSNDLETLQRQLQELLGKIHDYVRPICKSDESLTDHYELHKKITDTIHNEQGYLNAYENELRNLNNLGEYLFHLEREGESYIGLKLYEGHRLSHYMPPKRVMRRPRINGMSNSAEGLTVTDEHSVKITRRQKYIIISGLLDAIRAMHAGELRGSAAALGSRKEMSIIHRDLKPSNIIVDDQLMVHVVDKGLATAVELGTGVISDKVVGTKAYMAPECTGKIYDGTHYSEKSDMFSVGKILALFLDLAVVEEDGNGRAKAILLEYVDYRKVSESVYKLISRLQSQDRDQRPTSKEAFAEFERIRYQMHELINTDPFVCYTIKLSDLSRVVRDHKLKAFAARLAEEGANSIAFIRDTDSVTQSDIVRMMRKLRHEGIMHFAPEIFTPENVTDRLPQYYKDLFISEKNVIRSSRDIAKDLRVISRPTTIPIFSPIPTPENPERVRISTHRRNAPQKAPQKELQTKNDKK